MKSNKLKTTIRPIDGKYIIVKTASKQTRGQKGMAAEVKGYPQYYSSKDL